MNNGDPEVSQANATESQESVYARNRAIYEASLASQQPQIATNGNGTLPAYTFEKQARPRSSSPDKIANATENPSDSGEPARKKLVRAGDLVAQKNSPEPGTPVDPNITNVSLSSQHSINQEGLASSQHPVSAEKSAFAQAAGTAHNPSLGSPSASSNAQKFRPFLAVSANPGSNPFVAQPTYSPPSNGQIELDQTIETKSRAFVVKNPGVPLGHVKSALKHSKGNFDQNFTTALKLLMQSLPVSNGQVPATVSPTLVQGAFNPQNPSSPQQQRPQPVAAPLSARYPGQNSAPQQSPPYPGSAAFQTIQQQGSFTPQQQPARNSPSQQQNSSQTYPHQMQSQPATTGGHAQNINGQSAAALSGQQFYSNHGRSQSPVTHSSQLSASGQTILHPPPPLVPGTHPQLGFSALQVLPSSQHAQFLQLAPIQQIEYSASVFASLGPEQKNTYTVQAQAQARMRESWNRQQQQQQNGGMVMIPPGGRGSGQSQPVNPYVGYASQLPTQQQQMQQQRFPGQNPVFRVGAPQQGSSKQPNNHQNVSAQQQAYYAEQHRVLLAQIPSTQRTQLLALPQDTQMQWVYEQLRLRMDHQKRAAQQQARIQQQQMMADKHQEHKQTKAVGKKKRRRNYSDSDDDDDLRLHDTSDEDNDDEDVDGGDGSEAEGERESKGVQWFNSTTVEELMEMTGKAAVTLLKLPLTKSRLHFRCCRRCH